MGIAVYINGEPPDIEHTQVERTYDGQTVEIDTGIVDVIDWLNRNRKPTTSCCQGDFENFLDASVGFWYELDAMQFFEWVAHVWRDSEFKKDELSSIEFGIGYNHERCLYGYGVNFDCRILPDLMALLKTIAS